MWYVTLFLALAILYQFRRYSSTIKPRQISIIEPKVIVTLGAPATRMILDTKIGIMKLRGQWSQFDGLLPDGPSIAVMPTYHPAYLLRAYTMENRKKVWSDLQQVMDRLKESS